MMKNENPTVFILGLSSDIGREMGKRYLVDGYRVYGTYRQKNNLEEIFHHECLFPCDVTNRESIQNLSLACQKAGLQWNIFIGLVGTEEPVGSFFDCNFDAWERSITINALGLLRVLHSLYALRSPDEKVSCVFFTGAGTNNAAVNYSAYCASKILLIKMCELLAAENPDLNPVIIGPGIVRTKIHEQTLRAGKQAGKNYEKVVRFVNSNDPGVSHDDIYACVNWCIQGDVGVTGGRNFSVVHDAWREDGDTLREMLIADSDMYKLRRYGNNRMVKEQLSNKKGDA